MPLRHWQTLISRGLCVGLLVATAFGLLESANAASVDDEVNTKIKEEFIHTQAQQMQADHDYPAPTQEGLTASPQVVTSPLNPTDPALNDQDISAPGEQAGAIEMPQAGISRKSDPMDPIEQQIEEKQAYDLYRSNYRRAVQEEFIRRLHNAGYTTNRDIAAEIKKVEIRAGISDP